MKITNRKSDLDIPEILIESFTKMLKEDDEYKNNYLFYRSLYSEKYSPNFMDVNEFVKYHDEIHYCEAIIRENGMIEYAYPSHEIASILAYPLMSEEEYYLSCYNLTEYTGYVFVYYEYINAPTYITKEQLNTLKILNEAGCININYGIINKLKIIG